MGSVADRSTVQTGSLEQEQHGHMLHLYYHTGISLQPFMLSVSALSAS